MAIAIAGGRLNEVKCPAQHSNQNYHKRSRLDSFRYRSFDAIILRNVQPQVPQDDLYDGVTPLYKVSGHNGHNEDP